MRSPRRKSRKKRVTDDGKDPDFSKVRGVSRSGSKVLSGTRTIRPKEAAVLKASLEGANPKKALEAAGIPPMEAKAARNYVKHIKEKYVDSNGMLLVALEKTGVTLDTLASKIREGLEAETTVKSGKDVVTVPDYRTQHKYLETALDIVGGRAPTKSVVETVKTHEETVAIVQGISNSDEAMKVLWKRIEGRESAKISKARTVQADEEDEPQA